MSSKELIHFIRVVKSVGLEMFTVFLYYLLNVEESWLKAQIHKSKIMASCPTTSWQIDGETVTDFICLDSKITADGDCSHEIKRRLLLGRKVMTNLESILKSRDITLSTKVHLVKAMVFPVICMDVRVGL